MPLVMNDDLTNLHGVLIYHVEGRDPAAQNAEAVAVLNNKPPGTFYMRVSSIKGCLVVQFVKDSGSVDKRLVEPVPNNPTRLRISVHREDSFANLRELIEHFCRHPIAERNNFEGDSSNTLSRYYIQPDLFKFSHRVTSHQSSAVNEQNGPEFLLCGENEEVAVVKDTAKWLFAVHKKTGMYGKLRNDVATEPADALNLAEDLADLLYIPPGYSPSMHYPTEAVALVDYGVPYSESTLVFRRGDLICVEGPDSKDGGMLLGYLKHAKKEEENTVKSFPLFSVKFLKQYASASF